MRRRGMKPRENRKAVSGILEQKPEPDQTRTPLHRPASRPRPACKSNEVVREALRRYENDMEAERAAIDALWALAAKSEAGEAVGDFVDMQDQANLNRFMGQALGDALARSKAPQSN